MNSINGTLNRQQEIVGVLNNKPQILGVMEKGERTTTSEEYPFYDGEYTVIPKINKNIELETQKKRLKENVVINKTPQYEVSNPFGGVTFIIGED